MRFSDWFIIAFRNVTHKKVRSWLTLVGIFAGIAAVVALISLGQGMQSAIEEQFSSLGTNTISITGAGSTYGPPGTNAVGILTDKDVRLIEEVNGVEFVFGRYIQSVLIEQEDEQELAFAVSLPGGSLRAEIIEMLDQETTEGRIIEEDEHKKITVGSSITFNDKSPNIGKRVTIKDETFMVSGILKREGNPMFDNQIIMTEGIIEELFDLENDFSMIIVKVSDGENLAETKEAIERRLRRDRNQKIGEEDFEISTPQETLESLNSILLTVQVLLVGIAAISLIVGAIGIANTMYTAVLERRREIGIMKAVGAKNNDVLAIFLVESGLLGLAGGILGLIIGVIISKGVELGAMAYFGENIIKAIYPTELIIGALLFAFILGAISGTLPARQAAKLDPVESLRK